MAEYSKRNLRNIVSGTCNDDCPLNPNRFVAWTVEVVDCEHFKKDGYQCKLKKKGIKDD